VEYLEVCGLMFFKTSEDWMKMLAVILSGNYSMCLAVERY